MRWMTPGYSISAMTRIGPLHLGHSSGSASQTLRIRRAQAVFTRAANSTPAGGYFSIQYTISICV